MSLDCNQTKERLEELIDQIVDAGLQGKASGAELTGKDSQDFAVNKLTLSAECQEHLNQCADCRDYQTANRMLIDAAAVLPKQVVPQADLLTANIMQLVMAEPAYTLESQAAQTSLAVIAAAPAANRSYREIYLVLLSFAAFAATSAYGQQLDDSLWNIGSWTIALLVFAALKPLIEQPSETRTLLNTGMPA